MRRLKSLPIIKYGRKEVYSGVTEVDTIVQWFIWSYEIWCQTSEVHKIYDRMRIGIDSGEGSPISGSFGRDKPGRQQRQCLSRGNLNRIQSLTQRRRSSGIKFPPIILLLLLPIFESFMLHHSPGQLCFLIKSRSYWDCAMALFWTFRYMEVQLIFERIVVFKFKPNCVFQVVNYQRLFVSRALFVTLRVYW